MTSLVLQGDDAGFRHLTEKIARERQFACASYKDRCLRRRIAVRMRACSAGTYEAYARHLDAHPDEWGALLSALTINVTKFFRNQDVYDVIARVVVPSLWASRESALRVWSAGCASGEEPASLGILFHRHAVALGGADRVGRLRILGSDVDEASLDAARAAVYPERAFAETPPDIRRVYFSAAVPAALVSAVRAMMQFERRDLVTDRPPPGPFHLIVCRNVLIYLDRDTQARLVERFHKSLVPGGFLVLGKTETLFGLAQRSLFEAVDARARVFRK